MSRWKLLGSFGKRQVPQGAGSDARLVLDPPCFVPHAFDRREDVAERDIVLQEPEHMLGDLALRAGDLRRDADALAATRATDPGVAGGGGLFLLTCGREHQAHHVGLEPKVV
jgi:hypothetical protein